MRLLRFAAFAANVAQRDESKRHQQVERVRNPEPAWQSYVKVKKTSAWQSGGVATNLSPMERLNNLEAALAKLDRIKPFHAQQKVFFKAYTVAMLSFIFGNEIHRYMRELMQRYRVTEIREDVLVIATRRMGKTYATAAFAAALALTQPGIAINIFSTGQRTATALRMLVWNFIIQITDDTTVITAQNEKFTEVRGPENSRSVIRSLPGVVEISFLWFFSALNSVYGEEMIGRGGVKVRPLCC